MANSKGGTSKFVVAAIIGLAVAGAATAWYFLDPGFRAERKAQQAGLNGPQDAFESRVREYILRNPEVIVEAMQRLQARQRADEDAEVRSTLRTRADELLRDPESPVGGNVAGDVTLVEFFDYNCPYCRRVAPAMAEAETADKNLRIVYKEIPILGPNSVFAAKAALAAQRQGKYVEFHKALMSASGIADETRVLSIAGRVGLDIGRLRKDMQDGAIQASIDRNLALAQALRINGTPSFVAGETILRGAAELGALQSMIRKAREKTGRVGGQ